MGIGDRWRISRGIQGTKAEKVRGTEQGVRGCEGGKRDHPQDRRPGHACPPKPGYQRQIMAFHCQNTGGGDRGCRQRASGVLPRRGYMLPGTGGERTPQAGIRWVATKIFFLLHTSGSLMIFQRAQCSSSRGGFDHRKATSKNTAFASSGHNVWPLIIMQGT
jgi:hypothetical protein